MKTCKLSFALVSAVFAAVLLAAPAMAFADTYKFFNLQSDEGRWTYGLDDAGTVVVHEEGPTCGLIDGAPCYGTYVNGARAGLSSTIPALSYDNGTACNGSPAGVTVVWSVCNGTRSAYMAYPPGGSVDQDLYVGSDLSTSLPFDVGGPLFMNASGDIVFFDVSNEFIVEGIDVTAAAPEPGSFLLLGTGAVSVVGIVRRRLCAV